MALTVLGIMGSSGVDAKSTVVRTRVKRHTTVVAPVTGTTGLAGTNASAQSQQMADRVVVYKARRYMELLRGPTVLRTYHVALGQYPEGPKEREGDSRTPEGRYYLTQRNPRSDYFLSIQVSYPNKVDEARARAGGWDPGGLIMIHGRPNELRREPRYYETHDWTDGCISVSDSDMLEIWLMTPSGIPIDIYP